MHTGTAVPTSSPIEYQCLPLSLSVTFFQLSPQGITWGLFQPVRRCQMPALYVPAEWRGVAKLSVIHVYLFRSSEPLIFYYQSMTDLYGMMRLHQQALFWHLQNAFIDRLSIMQLSYCNWTAHIDMLSCCCERSEGQFSVACYVNKQAYSVIIRLHYSCFLKSCAIVHKLTNLLFSSAVWCWWHRYCCQWGCHQQQKVFFCPLYFILHLCHRYYITVSK